MSLFLKKKINKNNYLKTPRFYFQNWFDSFKIINSNERSIYSKKMDKVWIYEFNSKMVVIPEIFHAKFLSLLLRILVDLVVRNSKKSWIESETAKNRFWSKNTIQLNKKFENLWVDKFELNLYLLSPDSMFIKLAKISCVFADMPVKHKNWIER